jgi:hypothetical protein
LSSAGTPFSAIRLLRAMVSNWLIFGRGEVVVSDAAGGKLFAVVSSVTVVCEQLLDWTGKNDVTLGSLLMHANLSLAFLILAAPESNWRFIIQSKRSNAPRSEKLNLDN